MDCPNCKFKIDDGSPVCPFCAFVIPKPKQDPNTVGAPVDGAPASKEPLPDIQIVETPEPGFSPPAEITVDPVLAPKKSGGLLWLVAAGALGYGVYYHLLPMMRSQPPAEPAQAAPPPAAPAPPKPAEAPAPAQPPPAEAKPPEEPPKPAAPAAPWEFEGLVYDVVTLKPVPGVEMTFLSDANTVAGKTGPDGRFKLRLPALDRGSYRLVTDHPDYAEEYFDESVANYRKMPLPKRLTLRNVNPKHPVWMPAEGMPLQRSVALFPLAPDQ